jgi:hypothetical protein
VRTEIEVGDTATYLLEEILGEEIDEKVLQELAEGLIRREILRHHKDSGEVWNQG